MNRRSQFTESSFIELTAIRSSIRAALKLRSGRSRHTILCVLAALAGILTIVLPGAVGRTQDRVEVFATPPRQISRPIEQAKELLAKEDYAEAVTVLGKLLANNELDDFFTPTRRKTVSSSIRSSAELLLEGLPQRGRDVYELRYGIQAETEMRKALEDDDFQALQQVARQYFHTRAGNVATLLLGRQAMFEGSHGMASRYFRRLHQSAVARQRLDPELSILFAVSLFRSDRGQEAVATIQELKASYPTIRIDLNEQPLIYTIGDANETLEWLQQWAGNTIGGGVDRQEWRSFRAGSNRDSLGTPGAPLPIPHWKLPVAQDDELPVIETILNSSEDNGQPVIPGVSAIAIKDTVLMRTSEQLIGIDFKTGKRTWMYPWESKDKFPDSATAEASPVSQNEKRKFLKSRLLDDGVYGKISSNGTHVFFVEEKITDATRSVVMNRTRQGRRTTNSLIALKVLDAEGRKVEGQFAWKIDGETATDPDLANAFFFGPPVSLDGTGYVLYEIPGQIRVLAIDDSTGEKIWSQQIARTDNKEELPQRLFRQKKGGMPLVENGLLICPSLTGALVAIDLSDRSLKWGIQYETLKPWEFVDAQLANREPPWFDNGLMIVDDILLFSPVDSKQLYSISTEKGRIQRSWQKAKDVFIAGGFRNSLVTVSPDAVSITATSGLRSRKIKFGELGTPSGLGFFAGEYYYLPLSKKRLVQFDLTQAKIATVFETPEVLGNLICYKGRIVSHSPRSVISLYQMPFAEREAERILNARDGDPIGLLLKGQILADQDVDSAIEALAGSLRQIGGEASQSLLTELLVTKINNTVDPDWSKFQPFELLLKNPADKRRFLVARIESFFRSGKSKEAVPDILKLVDLFKSSEPSRLAPDQAQPIELSPTHTVDSLRLMRARLGRATNALEPQGKLELLAQLQKTYLQQIETGHVDKIRTATELFGEFDFVDESFPQIAYLLYRVGNRANLVWCESHLLTSIHSRNLSPAQKLERLFALSLIYHRLALTGNPTHFPQLVGCYRQILEIDQLNDRIAELQQKIAKAQPGMRQVIPNREMIQQRLNGLQNAGLPSADFSPDGMTRIQVYEDDDDLDYYVDGDENRIPARLIHHLRMVNENFTVEITDHGFFTLRNQDGKVVFAESPRQRGGRHFDLDHRLTSYQVLGSVLVLSFGYDHVAVDLAGMNRKDPGSFPGGVGLDQQMLVGEKAGDFEQRVLWRFSAFEPSADPTFVAPRITSSRESNILGFPVVVAQDENRNRVGTTTQLNPKGYCLLNGSNLYCLDPWTGKVLWKRSDIPERSDLMGGKDGIFVITPDDKSFYRIDPLDGTIIHESQPSEFLANRLFQSGSTFLTYRGDKTSLELVAVDLNDPAPTQVWRRKLPAGTQACPVNTDSIAILEPGGRFSICRVDDGKDLIVESLKIDGQPKRLEVDDRSNQFLIFVSQSPEVPRDSVRRTGNRENTRPVDGQLFAISKQTKRKVWQSPLRLSGYDYVLNNALSNPLLLFKRRNAKQKETDLLLIRTSDGSAIEFSSPIPAYGATSIVKLSDDRRSVLFNFGYEWLQVKMTAFPRPVEPPAQIGPASSEPDKDAASMKEFQRSLSRFIFGNPEDRTEDALLKNWTDLQWRKNPMNTGRNERVQR